MSATPSYTQIILIEGTARAKKQFFARLNSARLGNKVEFGEMVALAYARCHGIPYGWRWGGDEFRTLQRQVRYSNPVIVAGPELVEVAGREVLMMIFEAQCAITTEQLWYLSSVSPGLRLTEIPIQRSCGHLDRPGGDVYSDGSWIGLEDEEVAEMCAVAGYPAVWHEDEPSKKCYELPDLSDLLV